MHLPLISQTSREALLESLQFRERAALARLSSATGGQSLCVLSHGATSVSAVKYHEGAAAALAEARRSVRAVAEGPDGADGTRLALLDVRARWWEQARSKGRSGPNWIGYLAGGLDALEQLVDA